MAGAAPTLFITPDRLRAILRIPGAIPPDQASEPFLQSILIERGVPLNDRSRQAIAGLLAARRANPAADAEGVVAEGVAPEHGIDGSVEILVKPAQPAAPDPAATPQTTDAETKSEAVDHYQRSSLLLVKEGQPVARVHPPREGKDGVDVLGRAVAARQARPASVTLDESVRRDADGTIVALRSGILRAGDNLIRVSDELSIDGYVDFSTGHVEFAGKLSIAKGVRDLFRVRAGTLLTVHGLVEAATIESAGDALLHGGMAGREKGTLKVARDLTAKYVDGCRVHVGRDVSITREVSNCTFAVGRSLRGPACAIMGGAAFLAHASEVAQLGSEGAVATEVILGKNADLERLAKELAAGLPKATAQKAAIEAELTQLKANIKRLTHTQAEKLTELEFELSDARARLTKLQATLARVIETAKQACATDLTVHRVIFPGVRLFAGAALAEFSSAVRGPVRIILSDSGEPTIAGQGGTPASPLARVAKVIPSDRFVDFAKLARLVAPPPAAAQPPAKAA